MLFIVCHLTQKKLQGGNVGKKPQNPESMGKRELIVLLSSQINKLKYYFVEELPFFLLHSIIHIYLKSIRSVWHTDNREQQRKTFWRDTIFCMFLGFSLSQFDLHSTHYGIQRASIGLYYSRKPHISYGWQKFNLNGSPSNSIKILNKSKAKHRVVKHYRWVLWEQRTTHPPCVTGFSTYFHLSLGLVEEWKGEFGNQIYASA